MNIFDTHIHFNDEKFGEQFEESLHKYKHFYFNIVGTSLKDSMVGLYQTKNHPNVVCAIGIHPSITEYEDEEEVFYCFHKVLKTHKKIVAIGEVGLDFHHNKKELCYERQKSWFLKQAELAKAYNLPLILHTRNAYSEMYELLKEIEWRGILHSYDGSLSDLDNFLSLPNWMISISPIYLRNVEKFKEIIARTPLDRLLIESDAPFLTKNHAFIESFITTIAEIKHITVEEATKAIFKNSCFIFNLN